MKRLTLAVAALAALALVVSLWILREDAPRGAAVPGPTPAAKLAREDTLDAARAPDRGTAVPPPGSTRAAHSPDADSGAIVPGPTLVLARVTAMETGEPVEHVFVSAWKDDGLILATSQVIETDEEGSAEIEVPHGVALVVSAQGVHSSGVANVAIGVLVRGERRAVHLVLRTREDLVVHGIVLRRDTREAIAGARVEGEALLASDPSPRAVTGNDGRFRLELRSFALAALRYEHEDHGTAFSPVLTGHESAANPLEILLERCASIRASVVALDGSDMDGCTLVATARVWDLEQPVRSWIQAPRFLERSAEVSAGVAWIANVPARAPLQLALRRGSTEVWRARAPLILAPLEVGAVECRIGQGGIHGFVREADGTPAAGIALRIVAAPDAADALTDFDTGSGFSTESGPDGAYRFVGIDPGVWYVGPALLTGDAADPRRDPTPIAERVEFEDASVDARHDLVLVRGVVIAGRVEHPGGGAGAAAWVTADARETHATRSARADADGRFVIGPLKAGPWTLRASSSLGLASEPTVIDAGREDVVLKLLEQAILRVEVQDEHGALLAQAPVTLFRSDQHGDARSARADARGVVTFGELPAIPHDISVATDDGRFAAERGVLPGKSGVTRVVLVARPGGRGQLRFEGPGSSAIVLVTDRGLLVQMASLVRGQTFAFTGPLGEVDVQLHVAGKRHDRRVRLEREPGATIVFDGGWR